jgi:hypothetical protein
VESEKLTSSPEALSSLRPYLARGRSKGEESLQGHHRRRVSRRKVRDPGRFRLGFCGPGEPRRRAEGVGEGGAVARRVSHEDDDPGGYPHGRLR